MKAQRVGGIKMGIGGVVVALAVLTSVAPGIDGSRSITTLSSPQATAAIPPSSGEMIQGGRTIFESSCAACHYRDRVEVKVGPGLQGLYKRASLPVSGRPVSDENVTRQLRTPADQMPEFPHLSDPQVASLLAYLQTI